jgi:hypothetical protein
LQKQSVNTVWGHHHYLLCETQETHAYTKWVNAEFYKVKAGGKYTGTTQKFTKHRQNYLNHKGLNIRLILKIFSKKVSDVTEISILRHVSVL